MQAGIIAKHLGPLSADQIPTPAEMKNYLISYVPSASCIGYTTFIVFQQNIVNSKDHKYTIQIYT